MDDAPDEGRFPGRVEVDRAGVARGQYRRPAELKEGADGCDEDVARLDERAKRRVVRRINLDDVEAAALSRKRRKSVPIAAGKHRSNLSTDQRAYDEFTGEPGRSEAHDSSVCVWHMPDRTRTAAATG